ncbi:3'-5' exonuclease KapD [Falsibacillus albus]|uniref:3'-5' exonuclease KapD n=1 Tax=Falsibacillus albus TaxID=2478915 RepID=A0A3L7K1B3_9BACI|nr:3'-5' exonuclease KapD [Falsibacillus albus]RLQ96873.1 3'-5' exonuclease KapD [Falsibacillus albus]
MVKQYTIFIDFEFSMPQKNGVPKGFYPEIIEAGLAVVHNDEIIDQFSSYVRPRTFTVLTDRCKGFLKITQHQVDEGISIEALIDKFKEYDQRGKTTVVTWGNMDMKVLRDNCRRADIPFPFTGQFIDLSMEYKKFFGDQNQTGLWKAVKDYGKDGVGKHHRALDDALTTYNIYKLVEKDKQYLKKTPSTTIGDRIDLAQIMKKFAL